MQSRLAPFEKKKLIMSAVTVWLLMLSAAGTAMCQNNCNGDVRLVGGTSPQNGRLQVCYNDQWGGVCSFTGSSDIAFVVCRQLGWYPYEAQVYSRGYDANITTFLKVDYCGNVDQLLGCNRNRYNFPTLGYYNCSGYNDIVINCTLPVPEYCSGTCTNGSIRLVGGPSPYEGRVEVCVEGCWGTVCGNGFYELDASVACRQLGFPALGATPIFSGSYGKGSGPIWLFGLNCTGTESSLFDCPHYYNSIFNDRYYYHYDYYHYDYNNYYYRYTYSYSVYSYIHYEYPLIFSAYAFCSHNADVGVRCPAPSSPCSHGDIRLINGSTPMEGLVEVCIEQQWGAVCGDDQWTSDTSGASIVCKQLGYSPSNATSYRRGDYKGVIFLFDVQCDARAARLVDCSYSYQDYFQNCYGLTAGVRCQASSTSVCTNGTVRLVGASTPYEGRVEVCAHGTWGTVCSRNWDLQDASVVCGQLGYEAAGVVLYSYQYGGGTSPIWLKNAKCGGTEQLLLNCPVTKKSNNNVYCDHSYDVAVQCTATVQNCTDWDIRLVGGSSPLEGRVEVCYMNQWGTICGYTEVPTLASVICRQLGYSSFNSILYSGYNFGSASGGIFLYTQTLFCTGNETGLKDCYHTPIGYHQCFYGNIGIHCAANITGTIQCTSGSFQLVGGSVPSEGRVEICLGGNWSTICGYSTPADSANAAVICHQLGFNSSGAELVSSGIFGQGIDLGVWMYSNCMGNEASFLQCPQEYFYLCNEHRYDIGVRCTPASSSQCLDGDVRLVNGTNGTMTSDIIEGVVQICYAGHWGVVIGVTWTLREASVVCRQLHYAPVALKAFTYSMNGAVTGNVTFSGLYCVGYEKKILDCYHGPPGYQSYYHYYYYYYSTYAVGVRCQVSCNECQNGTIRLVGGNTSHEGRVEVCEGECWGPVCIGDSGWSTLDAAVVCNQLQMGSEGAVPRYYYSLQSPPILAPHCTGNEPSLFSCAQSVCHNGRYNYAGVMCLPKSCTLNEAANKMAPNITVMIESGVSLNITTQPESVLASFNSQVILICQTTGCLTTWYKDNVIISNESRLEIPALALSHRGFYLCKSGDMSSMTVKLSVKGFYQYLIQIELNPSATVDTAIMKLASIIGRYVLNNTTNITQVANFSYSGSSLTALLTLDANRSISYDLFSNELKALLLVALESIGTNITSIRRFDGCPLDITCDDKYVWSETEIGTVDTSYSCIQRRCGGTYSTGGQWEPVVFACATDYASCALQEWEDLLTAALINTEVAATLLRGIDNFLDTKQQIQDPARLLNILNYYSNNVIINETTVFVGISFATQLEDVNITNGCFAGRNFSVNLGSVEAAIAQNTTIFRSAIASSKMENTTASVLVLPPSSNECAQNTASIYRLTFYTFLQNVLFQSAEQEKEGFKIGSIIISVGGNAVRLAEKLQFSFQVVKDATNAKPAQWINDSNQAGVWSTEDSRILSVQNNTFITEVKLGSKPDRTKPDRSKVYQGNFAMLLDLNPDSSVKCPAADIVTQIGIILSIFSLLFFLVTYICSKSLRRSEHGTVLINMSCALLCLYIVFLMATYSKSVPVLCGISAALVHYFMLVYFMWTAAEAVFLFFKLVKVLGSKINRFTLKAGLVSWLVPLGIVIISTGAGYRNYYNSNYCRASELPFYLGFISPFLAICVFNWIMFIIIMVSLCKTSTRLEPNNSKGGSRHKLRNNVIIAAGLALVLGLGWGFGLAASSNNITALTCSFQFLFSVFVGCQGLLILFFHGVRNKNAKRAWRSWIGLHTTSYTVTMSVKPGEGDAKQSHGDQTASMQHTSCAENQPSLSQDDTSCDEPPQMATTTEKKLVDKGLQLFKARVERYAASIDENVSEKDAAQKNEPASSDELPQKAACTTERKLIDEESFKDSDERYVVSIDEKVLEKEVVQKKAPRSFKSLSLLKKNASGAISWFRSDSQVTAVLLRSEEDKDDDNSAMI